MITANSIVCNKQHIRLVLIFRRIQYVLINFI